MKRTVLVAFAVTVLALGGCKSKSVSRVYPTDMETTWAAVLRAAEAVSDQKPSKVDVVNRKVVTGWVYTNVRTGPGEGPTTQRSTEIWRGLITCKSVESGTEVKISIRRGYASSEETPGAGTDRGDTIGVSLKSDTHLQNQFLDDVAAELAKEEEALSP